MTLEEKRDLINLSDLNREDNIKYISSEAQGVAIELDSDRLAPTFCKLERAYICGRRISEKQIVKLQEENERFKEQIEKMKCCENCKYNSYWGNEMHCNYGLKEALQEDKLVECKNMDKWEVKE